MFALRVAYAPDTFTTGLVHDLTVTQARRLHGALGTLLETSGGSRWRRRRLLDTGFSRTGSRGVWRVRTLRYVVSSMPTPPWSGQVGTRDRRWISRGDGPAGDLLQGRVVR